MSVQAMLWAMDQSVGQGSTRHVLTVIGNYLGHGAQGWCTVDRLSHQMGVSRATVKRALRQAEELGDLLVYEGAGGTHDWPGQYRPSLYAFPRMEDFAAPPFTPRRDPFDLHAKSRAEIEAGKHPETPPPPPPKQGAQFEPPEIQTVQIAPPETSQGAQFEPSGGSDCTLGGFKLSPNPKNPKNPKTLSLTSTSEEPPDAEPEAGERDQSQIEAMADALAEAVGWTQVGRAQRSDLTAAARDLISQGATTEGVRHAPRRWAEMGRTHQLTPRAIARWWAELAPAPEPEITEGARKLREFEARVGREATYDELNEIWGIDG